MFEELRTFITVVECKNFTKAGEMLHLSQPSVSAHVKNLESRFQTILIHRSVKQKSIVITESGYRLYQYAKEILQLTEQAYIEVPDNSSAIKGHLRLGASLTIGEFILPSFLASFSKKYPDIEIEVFMDNTATISQKVKDLTLDIGLVEGAISSSQFIQEYFLEDQLVLAFPYRSNFNPKKIDYHNLNTEKWIVRERGSGTREYADLFLSNYEITPKQIMVMGSNYAIIQSVTSGLGITILSKFVAEQAAIHHQVCTIELESNFKRHFSYIMPKTIAPSFIVEHFIEELKNYTAHLSS